MDLPDAIAAVLARRDLDGLAMRAVMTRIMTGEATAAQIGGFLVGLRAKGETVEEITAAAEVMRALATRVEVAPEGLVDTCGTGGDGARTFNISTTAAFVIAAAGGRVAKHGNRSVSSRSGSADVLEAAGAALALAPEAVAHCIETLGVGFLYAPAHHTAMRHAIGPRRELGVRTVFNLLGPLTNPAGARRQLVGVWALDWIEPVAHVLGRLGAEHVMVVHGSDGLDEIALAGPTEVAEFRDGRLRRQRIAPEDYGIPRAPLAALVAEDVTHSLALMRAALDDVHGPPRDVVRLNAGAALYVAGRAASINDGVALATAALADGRARDRFERFLAVTQALAQPESRP